MCQACEELIANSEMLNELELGVGDGDCGTSLAAGATGMDHRLNSSSSFVLMVTSLSYGESKKSTPHRIKTPDPIEIKFGMVDYVGEGTRHANFYANSSKGGFSANG